MAGKSIIEIKYRNLKTVVENTHILCVDDKVEGVKENSVGHIAGGLE